MNLHDEREDFRRQCERPLRRTVSERIGFGVFRPVRDAGIKRSFSRMREDRRFCAQRYAAHFEYARPAPD